MEKNNNQTAPAKNQNRNWGATFNKARLVAEESSITFVLLGYVVSGVLGGAALMGQITISPELQRAVGAAMVSYVMFSVMLAIYFAVKFVTKKGK